MMKKILFLALVAFPISMLAQTPVFGYTSYDSLLVSMPDYTLAVHKYEDLEKKYAAETRRVENEFNSKYEQFLEGQRDFPATILKKRQTELQELMDKNMAFKAESRRLLAEAKKEIMKPLHEKLSQVLTTIGKEQNLMFILNTDNNACPFVNPEQGVDVTNTAKSMLEQL